MAKKKNKIQKIKDSLKVSPASEELILKLVSAYRETGDFKNATKVLNQNSALLAKPIFDMELAEICLVQGELKQAVNLYQSCIEPLKLIGNNEKLATVYSKLAQLWIKQDAFHATYYYYQSASIFKDETVINNLNFLIYNYCKGLNANWLLIKSGGDIFGYVSLEKPNLPKLKLNSLEPDVLIVEYNRLLQQKPYQVNDIELLIKVIETHDFFLQEETVKNWGNVLFSLLSRELFQINLALFSLPLLIERSEQSLTVEGIKNLALLKSSVVSRSSLPIHQFACNIVLFLIDSFSLGTDKALKQFVNSFYQISATDPSALFFSMPLWHRLYHVGYFENNHELLVEVFEFIAEKINEFAISSCWKMFSGYIYNINCDRNWNKLFFEKIVIPTALNALERNDFLYADRVITYTDLSYAQQPMTEEHNRSCREFYLPFLLQKARAIANNLPSLNKEVKSKTVIGFIVSMVFNGSSPIHVLFNIVTALKKISDFEVVIYCFYSGDVNAIGFFRNKGIRIVNLIEERKLTLEQDDYLSRLFFLKNLINSHQVDIVFFIQSTYFFMALAASLRLAPKHVFLEMTGGNSTFRIPEIEEYMSGGAIGEYKKVVNGYEWRCFQGKVSESLSADPNIKSRAAALRASQFSQFEVLLATIGRPQKIDNDDFIKMLSMVLKPNPQAAFLWFGNEELSSVKARMRHYGIEQQCFFQGWVDSKLYANLIDIHLDSFPFPCGITNRETMAVGCPNVFMYSEVGYNISMLSNILPVLKKKSGTDEQQSEIADIFISVEPDKSLLLYSENIESYVKNTNALINDKVFRKKVGDAGSNFIVNILENEKHIADMFTKHINEIMQK